MNVNDCGCTLGTRSAIHFIAETWGARFAYIAVGVNNHIVRLDPTVGATLSSCETSSAEYLAPLGAIYLVKLMIARTAGESTDVFDERMQELVPNPARYRTST
jgi:hypothetical protein